MKRLYELLNLINSSDIKNFVENHKDLSDDDKESYFKYLETGIESMKKVVPEISKSCVFCIFEKNIDYDFDEEKENEDDYYSYTDVPNAFQLLEDDMKSMDHEELMYHNYGIDIMNSWNSILGSYVCIHETEKHPFIEGLLSIIDEMTFSGNTEEMVNERKKELQKELDEAHEEIENGETFTIDEFKEEFYKCIEDEDIVAELRRSDELREAHEDEIKKRMMSNFEKMEVLRDSIVKPVVEYIRHSED